MTHIRAFAILLPLVAGLSITDLAEAQGDQGLPPTFEFSFSNPGARSMGFGGAFVALADDATAAFANPAGLVQLARPEVSIEGRLWSYSTPYFSGGRIWGEPTGIGLDDTVGLRTARSSEDLSGISFLSFVYPLKKGALAFYRHLPAKYEFHSISEGLYSGPWPGLGLRREFDQEQSVNLEMVSFGLSGAYRFTDTLSLGLGATYSQTDMLLQAQAYGQIALNVPPDIFFSPRPHTPENLFAETTIEIDDSDWGWIAGVLFEPSARWSLGGFFRQGPTTNGFLDARTGPSYPGTAPGEVLQAGPISATFPSVFGLGAAYRFLGERMTLSFEWDRVQYSSIFEETAELTIQDADELHLGGEYAFLRSSPVVAFRLGVWLDPDHRVDFDGPDYVAEALLQPGDGQLHVATGVGVAFKRLQLDLGIDASDLKDTVSLSAIYGF